MHTSPDFWRKPSLWAWLLWPASLLYQGGRWLHRRARLWQRYWAGVPVISVGNLTTGGAGKTPVVALLAQHFAQQGEQVAIVSRGYGGRFKKPFQVNWHNTPEEVGDEALMLYRRFSHTTVNVWIGRNRPATVRRAEQAGATLILLDDGFQRDDVARNVDIVVIDGQTGFGNGLCLPAGPLREPVTALKRADFAIIINSQESRPVYFDILAYRLSARIPTQALTNLKGQRVIAFAGLARPEKFFDALQREGMSPLVTLPFADHHPYTARDLAELQESAREHGAYLVTTEKDLVRLPEDFAKQVIALPLELKGRDMENIFEELKERLR
jgi:tetraacyldisaccharide 4'-kinase